MSLSWRFPMEALAAPVRRLALSGVVACMALAGTGCTSSGESALPSPTPGESGPDASISFFEETTVAIAPGETTVLTAKTAPPAPYEIAFLLLGDAEGASLDHSVAVANDDGEASVAVKAPDQAATFRLRATIKDGPSAEVGISVSDQGFGTLLIDPVYAGNREVDAWTVSATAQSTCSEIQGLLPGEPPDALTATGPDGSPIAIANAPVGPALAVTVRAAAHIWGCTDVTNLTAGAALTVKVPTQEKPLQLAETELDIELEFSPDPLGYADVLDAAMGSFAEAGFPSAESEATLLLDAMESVVDPTDLAAFQLQRSALAWDDVVSAHLDDLEAGMAETAMSWFNGALDAEPPVLTGRLTSQGVSGHALFEVFALGSLPASTIGFAPGTVASWTAQPGDKVLLGTTLYFLPSRYVGALAASQGLAAYPRAMSGGEALAQAIDCATLAGDLGSAGACDETCLDGTCTAAVAALWELAAESSSALTGYGSIHVAASGQAEVSEDAIPVAFDGSWVGDVAIGASAADASGTVKGVPPQDPVE